MHVEPAHTLPPGGDTGVADELPVALLVDDLELLGVGKGV
jgi:hypothetical protein